MSMKSHRGQVHARFQQKKQAIDRLRQQNQTTAGESRVTDEQRRADLLDRFRQRMQGSGEG